MAGHPLNLPLEGRSKRRGAQQRGLREGVSRGSHPPPEIGFAKLADFDLPSRGRFGARNLVHASSQASADIERAARRDPRPLGRAHLADGDKDVGGQRTEIGGLVGGRIGRRRRGGGERADQRRAIEDRQRRRLRSSRRAAPRPGPSRRRRSASGGSSERSRRRSPHRAPPRRCTGGRQASPRRHEPSATSTKTSGS